MKHLKTYKIPIKYTVNPIFFKSYCTYIKFKVNYSFLETHVVALPIVILHSYHFLIILEALIDIVCNS